MPTPLPEDTLLVMARELGVNCNKNEKTIYLPAKGRASCKAQYCINSLMHDYKYDIQTSIPITPLKFKK